MIAAGRKPTEASKYRLAHEAPGGAVAEGIRNLRAALSLLGPEADRRIFLFTSALPNEGKSFSSVNYALSLAQQGHRVLLVDADLRRPSVHKVFDDPGSRYEGPGVVDYLVGNVELEEASRLVTTFEAEQDVNPLTEQTPLGELYILAGGQRAPNPAELLSGDCFKLLVADAGKKFDRVVIDTAPVLAVSDTLLIVPHVRTVCMVLRASKTPRNAINRALTLMKAAGTRPAGLLLNRLPRRRGAGYYYYYSTHGYGEGSYTGQYPRSRTAPKKSSNGATPG